MGYEWFEYRIEGRISKHHDERDKRDRELWEELGQRVQDLVEEFSKRGISSLMWSGHYDPC